MTDNQPKPSAGEKRVHSEMSSDNVANMLSTTQQWQSHTSQRQHHARCRHTRHRQPEEVLPSFLQKYNYKHEVLCIAADEPSSVAFSFVADTAEPKDGVFTKLDDKETAPSRCLSIFMYTFNSDGKVNDIKFLRQPSKDEMARKFVKSPDYSSIPKFVGAEFSDPKYWEPSAETPRSCMQQQLPSMRSGRLGCQHCRQDPGQGCAEQFKKMITGVFKIWSPDQVKCSIAVTSDSNKAFIYWASHGEQTDTHQENHFYGLNLLIFNEKGLVKEILGFRQPLASERPQLLKADAQTAMT
ncbi:MAG: hypothetical protein FRX48_09854 [Lasallia pustulata]|uniref:Uncharacterized protein n=1 Tax=Lasallia pustulata TaxID=136370 RepID=A0A5M8PAN0_9LECA|nr:MAG: hypothetical protein FRX48_09854 [Lasallia pustulata]